MNQQQLSSQIEVNGENSYQNVFSDFSEQKLRKFGITKNSSGSVKIVMSDKVINKYMYFLQQKNLDFNKYLSDFLDSSHQFTYEELLVYKDFILSQREDDYIKQNNNELLIGEGNESLNNQKGKKYYRIKLIFIIFSIVSMNVLLIFDLNFHNYSGNFKVNFRDDCISLFYFFCVLFIFTCYPNKWINNFYMKICITVIFIVFFMYKIFIFTELFKHHFTTEENFYRKIKFLELAFEIIVYFIISKTLWFSK